MNIPNELSPNYIDGGYDSLVFDDLGDPGIVVKYYNHPSAFGDAILFLSEIEEYHTIHQRYAKMWSIDGVATSEEETTTFSVSVLDLWDDIFQLHDSKIIVTRVPKVLWYHCVIGHVLEAIRITLANNGIPIETHWVHYEWHYLSAKNILYTEEWDSKLNIVITDLWASIRDSLQFERRLQKRK